MAVNRFGITINTVIKVHGLTKASSVKAIESHLQ